MVCYILILAATLCCARAALVVSAYDDTLELTNSVENVGGCDARGCNMICKILGFADGVCVGGRCKCEIKELTSQEPSTSASVDDCNFNACDQLCRRLGFPGGACVGDRCKCDNFKQSLGVEPRSSPASLGDCDSNGCNEMCKKLGYRGGTCVGGWCKCDTSKQSLVSLLNSKSCDWQECNRRCWSHGLPGGTCFAGQCQCRTWKSDVENEIPVANVAQGYQSVAEEKQEPDVSMRSIVPRGSCDCDPRSCDMYCFRIHFIGGICLTGACRCYK